MVELLSDSTDENKEHFIGEFARTIQKRGNTDLAIDLLEQHLGDAQRFHIITLPIEDMLEEPNTHTLERVTALVGGLPSTLNDEGRFYKVKWLAQLANGYAKLGDVERANDLMESAIGILDGFFEGELSGFLRNNQIEALIEVSKALHTHDLLEHSNKSDDFLKQAESITTILLESREGWAKQSIESVLLEYSRRGTYDYATELLELSKHSLTRGFLNMGSEMESGFIKATY